MKIIVLIHAKNAEVLETYLSRVAETEDCVVKKKQEKITVYVNYDVIEFLILEDFENYKETAVSANIVFYPETESDRIFGLVVHGFRVGNLNNVIPQLPFLEYNENGFVGMMKDRLKYRWGF